MLVPLFISLFSLLGWISATYRLTRLPYASCPLLVISMLGIIQYLATLNNGQPFITDILQVMGSLLGLYYLIQNLSHPKRWHTHWQFYFFLALLSLFGLYTLHMSFSVSDEYVFWGAISKILFLTHHFAQTDTPMVARHLSYTPGLAAIHYYFLANMPYYSKVGAYFAQNIVLLAVSFVVVIERSKANAINNILLMITLLTILFGTILAKLSVDYLLATYVFAILWVYLRCDLSWHKWLVLTPSLLFLFLIKEIGLLLCAMLIIYFIIDTFIYANRYKVLSISVALLTLGLALLIKLSWSHYYQAQHFPTFAATMNEHAVFTSLAFWQHTDTRLAAWLYLKSIVIGPADMLNLPFIVWYIILGFCWYHLHKQATPQEKQRQIYFLSWWVSIFVIYNILLYLFEIDAFHLGTSFLQTISIMRYLNILQGGLILYTLMYFAENYIWPAAWWNKKVMIIFSVLLLTTLCIYRIPRLHANTDAAEQQWLNTIAQTLPAEKHTLCVLPGTLYDSQNTKNNFLGVKLLFELLPYYQVNVDTFPDTRLNLFKAQLSGCDYVLISKLTPSLLQNLQKVGLPMPNNATLYQLHTNPWHWKILYENASYEQ